MRIIGLDSEHQAHYNDQPDGTCKVRCSCGSEWTHKKEDGLDQQITIYKSHLAYFDKPRMGTL